ncbi:MAG: T9SS type B sorting domain-containing protein [Flavobacteriia bacterium]|nr:T9SS type B sorting domain-containing protein [Flavobacteriia bacterium]
MKKIYVLLLILFNILLLAQQYSNTENSYHFYENKGQIVDQKGKENSNVKYLFQSKGLNVQIKIEGFSYDVYEVKKSLKKDSKKNKQYLFEQDKKRTEYDYKHQYHRIDIDFIDANKNPAIIAEGKSTDYDNYYNLPNRPKGIEKVHRFQKITYKNLYRNIDLVFFKPDDSLKPIEYNFIVNPGGKISDIKLKFKGAKTKLKDGKLSMNLRFGEMQENIPHSWEEVGTSKKPIDVQFSDLDNQIFGFAAEKNASDKTVVIDPVPTRIWGSYFSGSYYDNTSTFIVADEGDNLYFGGQTTNPTNIATSGTHQFFILNGSYENGFVQKFNPSGNRLWGTYIGNLLYDTKLYAGILNDDALYIGGSTFDQTGGINNITTAGVHKQFASANTLEAFIMKLDFYGHRIWGTYYGGTGYEDIYDLNFDQNGDLLASGYTNSSNQITTPTAFLATRPNSFSGFFSKFSSSGQLLYGSYFYRPVNHITADSHNNTVIAGQYFKDNSLPDIGSTNTHQPNMIGYYNAYILKFDNSFTKIWGTYYGGSSNYTSATSSNNYISGLAVDSNDNIIIAGTTRSADHIATPGAYKENHNSDDDNGFIAKFLPDGKIDWSTYYGAENNFGNKITAMYVNNKDDIYVVGDTRSSQDIATSNAYQPNPNQSDDGYFAKFSKNGSLVWGTYYADRFQDYLQNITFKNNYVYVIGWTSGTDSRNPLGTYGTFMPTAYAGYYLAKFQDCQNNVQVSAASVVCPNSRINLRASGGTSYSWTGPNGFSSTLQNPTISHATATHAGTYICIITGTGDCDGTYSVTIKVEDKTAPIPNIAVLPTITGNCKTIITTIPTATDVCMGNIVATTANPLQYSLPGNYVITWKYDDGNGNISTQNQNVTITSEPLPIANAAQNFCKISSPKISDLQITGTSIKWYDAAGNPLNSNTFLTDGTKYYASQTLNGCESAKTEIIVTLNDPTAPTGSTQQDFCSAQNPTISHLTVTGQNIIWYDSTGAILTASTPLSDGRTYYATQSVNGCESTTKLAVKVSVANGGIPANDYSMAFCNDTTSSTKTVDLNDYNTSLIANTAGLTFEFYDSANQLIANPANQKLNIGLNAFHVKISNALGCFVYVKLNLTLHPKPTLNLPASAEFCSGQSVDLDAGSGFSSYEWTKGGSGTPVSTNRILNVTTTEKYTVKVKNSFGCENSASVTVTQSSLGTITGVQIVNNTAAVIMSNSGNFLYSLDNAVWQTSNLFSNLSNGNHTVYVKTSGGCVIGQMNFTIFNVPNSFTPNADGINDTWKIDGIENYPNSDIKVYDRNGKVVLSKITTGTFEWDGKFDSHALPTGSYWYIIKVSDGRILNGWLLIKNRN